MSSIQVYVELSYSKINVSMLIIPQFVLCVVSNNPERQSSPHLLQDWMEPSAAMPNPYFVGKAIMLRNNMYIIPYFDLRMSALL